MTASGQAGKDTREGEFTRPRWCYRVERNAPGRERPMMSYGTRPWENGPAEKLAVKVAYDTRIAHTYSGLLTVWVWEARQDEHYRLPVPPQAARFDFESGHPHGEPAPRAYLPPTTPCTRHTGADRQRYGCAGPDPADDPDRPLTEAEIAEALAEDGADGEARCARCGCTETRPCEGGCSWVPNLLMQDLCSACVLPDGSCATPGCGLGQDELDDSDPAMWGWALLRVAGCETPARWCCSPWCVTAAMEAAAAELAEDGDR